VVQKLFCWARKSKFPSSCPFQKGIEISRAPIRAHGCKHKLQRFHRFSQKYFDAAMPAWRVCQPAPINRKPSLGVAGENLTCAVYTTCRLRAQPCDFHWISSILFVHSQGLLTVRNQLIVCTLKQFKPNQTKQSAARRFRNALAFSVNFRKHSKCYRKPHGTATSLAVLLSSG